MTYLITFLEGLITFVSPCLLPILPIYISYFAGGKEPEKKYAALKNALGFVLGFTLVFLVLGAFAGSVGLLLQQYQLVVNIVSGLIVIFFGLHFLGVFQLALFKGGMRWSQGKAMGFWSAVVFGMVFSVGWTPCVGAFLGSALMLASQQASVWQGIGLLLCYSAGLGVPFLLSSILIQKLKSTFAWIKAHYRVINVVSGVLLIVVGIFMMTGMLGQLLALLS